MSEPPIPTSFSALSDLEQSVIYLLASPAGIAYGTEDGQSRLQSFRQLPENVRRVLMAEETAWKLYSLAVTKHHLSRDQTQTLAKIVQEVLVGEESPVRLRDLVAQRLGAPTAVTNDITATLTKQFITPNYFQISQLYERAQRQKTAGPSRQPGAQGRPTAPAGPRDDRSTPTSSQPDFAISRRQGSGRQEATPGRQPGASRDTTQQRPPPSTIQPPPSPKNVVDLRGKGVPPLAPPSGGGGPPPKLPPSPPPAPRRPSGSAGQAPRRAQPKPPAEESPEPPPAPSPPRGTHGPLPSRGKSA